VIEHSNGRQAASDLDQLALLLADVVNGGASVSFMLPFSVDDARRGGGRPSSQADPRAVTPRRARRGPASPARVDASHRGREPAASRRHREAPRPLRVHAPGVGRALMVEIEKRAHARLLAG